MSFRNVLLVVGSVIAVAVSVGSIVASSGCATWSDTTTGLVGGSAVLVGGGLATWAVAEGTVYDPGARDDNGRLIPVARQPEKNLIPVAIGVGALTVAVASSLYFLAFADAVDLGREPAPVGDAPPPMAARPTPDSEAREDTREPIILE